MARKRRRLHKRYRNRSREGKPAFRSNPPGVTELLEQVGTGFGGFAGTKVLTRFAAVQIARYKPSWAKHAGVIAAAASFGAAWWGAHRVKFLERYATPITVGAALAAVQTALQLWTPKIGWLVGDPIDVTGTQTQDLNAPDVPSLPQQMQQMRLQPTDEDPNWYTYDDKYDSGLYAKNPRPAGNGNSGGGGGPKTSAAAKVAADDDLLADLNLDDSSGVGGFGSIFN